MTTAIVVGAGVGGLTATLALRRAGVDVELLERAGESRAIRVGGGLHIWPNGMRVFVALGVAGSVAESGRRIARLDWHSPQHGLLASADLEATARSLGAPSIGIRRSDLLGGLLAAVGEESIRLGAEVVAFEQDGDTVTATLADGGEVRGDVLIGADGVQSAVRRQLVGEQELRAPGVLVVQATVEEPAREGAVLVEVWAPELRFGCYPVRDGTAWFAFLPATAAGELRERGAREHLLDRTAEWSVPAVGVVAATPPARVSLAEVVACASLDRWTDGRVTLLGDAAHAMTPFLGQGACQAIEDAFVLGRCVEDAGATPQALRAYEARRVPRTTDVWSRSWAGARSLATKSRTVDPARREAFAAAFERVVWKQLERTIAQEV